MKTPEYSEWWVKKINNNISGPSQENSQSIEEHLRVVPFELEIIKQDFERRNAELEKKIEQIEEEKTNLRLDVDVQKLEADKLRKGKNKAEEELDSLKMDYKKLHLSMRTTGLEKNLEQWRVEIREERDKSDWIEEIKSKIEGLEAVLQSCEVRIEHLETKKGRQNEQLHYFQNQVRNRDHVMGEAVVQIREKERIKERALWLMLKRKVMMDPYILQADASRSMNYQARLGSSPENNPVNPVIPDFDKAVEKEKVKEELPKQFEER
ncbi:hypothetical protein Golax_025737 [Gossypium laxum]|uniref:Uncharacterized protein n=1 Tax=Gossypium laxum TaxID=34288 RepID=A0A7J9B004_9ROSI|nr:hypothetical protein [Gossypium laxum]